MFLDVSSVIDNYLLFDFPPAHLHASTNPPTTPTLWSQYHHFQLSLTLRVSLYRSFYKGFYPSHE